LVLLEETERLSRRKRSLVLRLREAIASSRGSVPRAPREAEGSDRDRRDEPEGLQTRQPLPEGEEKEPVETAATGTKRRKGPPRRESRVAVRTASAERALER
jgi:hypothetical protein